MAKELPKNYEPKEVEDRIYADWIKNGYFHSAPNPDKKPYTIVIPPPNVTGQLHMGHALDDTLQDILIRYKRMKGFETLWIPGTDHAGIATQIKVEEFLRKNEGLTRYDLGREKFLERVWAWKKQYGDRIINQLKKLGASCDWDRERFTMDEGCSKAVREVFVNLYNKGIIYKGNRIINWCPHCRTALSDAEVEYSEHDGCFWYIKYPISGTDEFLEIATTRPETMLGDTAVAVHPEDERYTHLVGKMIDLPLVGRQIPIIADEYVERDFGTGCVKITPCHDPNDFEVGKRHNLPEILIMDEDGKINKNGGVYEGMERYAAREKIVEDLKALGLLTKIEKIKHNVGACYRCGTVVEPMTSKQWFVKMAPLAGPAIDVVESGDITFYPPRFAKTYLQWMYNVHDWCISRQLWWGHRIPAFYCDDCGEMTVSKTDVAVCSKCGGKHITQEEDVLDTWFSSALWPFSTLGWPEKTKELEYYYPTSVLVTAYDIIFFWVARMIFSGVEHTGKKPFNDVFIHGLIRDDKGRKMSKSLGNGIDPLEVIDKYGADALRFTLATGTAPGGDIRFYWERVEASRNFANKIWNAARFTLMNAEGVTEVKLPEKLENEDKWVVSRFNRMVKEVSENIEKYEIGIAISKLYDFIWDVLCDWYIELIKPRLFDTNTNEATKASARQTLVYVVSNTMKMLHPVMPFITEEIWQTLPHEGSSIMISDYPVYDEKLDFSDVESDMDVVIQAIKAIRNIRAEMNVAPSHKATVYIETEKTDAFKAGVEFIKKLASAEEVFVSDKAFTIENAVSAVSEGAKIAMPLKELIDVEKEKERLNKEKERITGEIARVNQKLSNESFVSKAPEKVVGAEKEKLANYSDMLLKINESLKKLG